MSDRIDYYEYINSEEWKGRAESAKRAADYRCQICYIHETETILDVHHRTYIRLGNELPTDLVVLCRACHSLYTAHERMSRPDRKRPGSDGVIVSARTGITDLDKGLDMLYPGDLILVGAQPRTGTTGFLAAIAAMSIINGVPVAIFSLQHWGPAISDRIVGHVKVGSQGTAGIDVDDLLDNARLLVDDTPGITPGTLYQKCLEIEGPRIRLIMVDRLDFMKTPFPAGKESTRNADICRRLKRIARQLDAVVVASISIPISDRAAIRPMLVDVNKLGGLDRIADIIMFLYRDELRNPDLTDRPNIMEIRVAKNNHGVEGYTVDAYWPSRSNPTPLNLVRQEVNL